MQKEVNETWLQFQGKTIITDEPDRDSFILITGEFEHGDMLEKNNQDGTVDRIYKIEPTRIEMRTGDKRLLGKAKRRASIRLRGALWHEYQKLNQEEDYFEDWYEQFVNKLIAYLPEVSSLLGTKEK